MKAFLIALLVLAMPSAFAENLADLDTRVQSEQVGTRFGDFKRHSALAQLRWQWDAPYDNAVRGVFQVRDYNDASVSGRVRELSLERRLGAGFLTVGKKVMSWDVGYAFRPLDVIQQEDRRALHPAGLEGVGMVAWEVFDEERAMTLVLSDPGSVSMRLYRHTGTRDEYFVLHKSKDHGMQGGASLSDVLSDAVEVHGSFLIAEGKRDKAMVGMTWTGENKISVLAEAWIDRTAAPGFERNALVRVSHNDGDWDIYADYLHVLKNDGQVAGVGVARKFGAWQFSASYRRYLDAAAPVVKHTAVATLQHAF
jgi:hypothetical protein